MTCPAHQSKSAKPLIWPSESGTLSWPGNCLPATALPAYRNSLFPFDWFLLAPSLRMTGMTQSAQRLLAEALDLDPVDRVQVIDGLYSSLADKAFPQGEAAWADEVESRVAAFKAGQLPADSAEAVLARINRR